MNLTCLEQVFVFKLSFCTMHWRYRAIIQANQQRSFLCGRMQECRIAKLFAKHFKVAEQEKLLESTVIGIASGTPNRLGKLADLAALKLDHLQLLILDVHLDAKQRCVPCQRAISCMDPWQAVV